MQEPRQEELKPDWFANGVRLPWSWVEEELQAERNFWLATITADGKPQARPLWGVWHQGRLTMSIGGVGLTRTSGRNGIPATMHLDSAENVVIIEGELEPVIRPGREGGTFDLGEELVPVLELWNAKYGKGWTPEKHAVNMLLHPRKVMAWREGEDREGPDAAGKWVFDQ